MFDVKQHDYENHQHHNRAGVDNDLYCSDKRRRERHVNRRERNEDANQRNRAVERITLRDHRDGATNRHACEDDE
jgi:hypothetical protein